MAAPVGVAQALPRLDAGSVYTARVGDALVTVLALPAIQTPARHTESHAVSLTHTHTHTRAKNIQAHSQNHSEVR